MDLIQRFYCKAYSFITYLHVRSTACYVMITQKLRSYKEHPRRESAIISYINDNKYNLHLIMWLQNDNTTTVGLIKNLFTAL